MKAKAYWSLSHFVIKIFACLHGESESMPLNERKSVRKSRQSSALPRPKLSQALARKMLRNHRKVAKNRAKKNWLNEENVRFLWLGRVSKTGRILGENRRPEIFAENGRFPAKAGGLGTLLRIWRGSI